MGDSEKKMLEGFSEGWFLAFFFFLFISMDLFPGFLQSDFNTLLQLGKCSSLNK